MQGGLLVGARMCARWVGLGWKKTEVEGDFGGSGWFCRGCSGEQARHPAIRTERSLDLGIDRGPVQSLSYAFDISEPREQVRVRRRWWRREQVAEHEDKRAATLCVLGTSAERSEDSIAIQKSLTQSGSGTGQAVGRLVIGIRHRRIVCSPASCRTGEH